MVLALRIQEGLGRLEAILHVEFCQDITQVIFDGKFAEVKFEGDFFIGGLLSHQFQHFPFTSGKVGKALNSV